MNRYCLKSACIFLSALMLIAAFVSCNVNEMVNQSDQSESLSIVVQDSEGETGSYGERLTDEASETVALTESESEAVDITEIGSDEATESETVLTSSTETVAETESETETETESEPDKREYLSIEESDGKATVLCTGNFKYTVSGYESINENLFSSKGGLVFRLDSPLSANFNRFTLDYASDSAVKIYVKYMENGGIIEDQFFVEAGEGSFSALVLNFLDKIDGTRLSEIRVEPCEKEDVKFAVFGLKTEKIDVPEKTYYVEGERYTLGLDLSWGGAISYLSDKKCPVTALTNLINRHDAGRLVQQSYYGTGEIPGVFEWGSFNNSKKWPYNPVQGGDRGAKKSRIIDIYAEEGVFYIKAQPMDWGKVGYITPSYMENRYFVEEDHVRVDNRFVDFSGWEHPYNSQELPAFYTVSYLDSFVWYGGTDPWTGDELSWRHDLEFWGNSEYASDCRVSIWDVNTEIWSAWVNVNDDYGIGLYAPNTDKLSSGRYQYNGSKSGNANPTNYTAPSKQIKLVSFFPLEYSYMLTTGSVEEIRAVFTEYKDFTDNACLSVNSVNNRRPYFDHSLEKIDMTNENGVKYVLYPHSTDISYDKDEGAVMLTVTGSDPYVSFDYLTSDTVLAAEDYSLVEIEYMIPATNGKESYGSQAFLCAGDVTGAKESCSTKFSIIKDGEYHKIRIALSNFDFWTGRINQIRLDYFNTAEVGDVFYIRSIAFGGEVRDSLESIDFKVEEGLDIISYTNRTVVTFDEELKAAKFEVVGKDPYIHINFGLTKTAMQSEDYRAIRITYMVPVGMSSVDFPYALFPCVGDVKAPSPEAQIIKKSGIIADGEFHTLEIDMSDYDFWNGKINMIRFDYFNQCSVGDVFYLAYVELVK